MWIKLHRSLTEWEWFNKSEMVHIFIYLLLKASYEDKFWQGRKIKRGQLITTRKAMSIDLGLSEQTIRTCLERLVASKEIKTKATNKYTLITICKYDSYQDKTEDSDNDSTNTAPYEQPTDNHQLTTSKEIKEVKNNNISLYNAHARETLIPPDLEDCYNILSNDRSWQESVLINLHSRGYRHIHFQQFAEHLQLFFSKLRAEGSDYKHPRDAKHHFTNWIIIQLEKQKNESNRTNHSRKQDANAYALSQFTDYYSNMDEEIPNPFTD